MPRSFIDLCGNSDVNALTKEVNKRLDAHDPSTAIGQVLYGLPENSAKLSTQLKSLALTGSNQHKVNLVMLIKSALLAQQIFLRSLKIT